MFKKRKGINVPYNKQGLIYFTCVNFKDMPENVQNRVKMLCDDIEKGIINEKVNVFNIR